ncbi:TLC domain-containing protein 4-like [Elephas maximus indicus]|uniref:TLC domain-containing protein 4-like n=1 Tax=Elephas maximus indicus TaxID=99487 RepID=UPI002115F2CE|nr:TLC domain-containing protein 4-like [Elephas maximus indicus]
MDTITKLGTVFASFVICQLIFHFVSSWFSTKVFPRFNSLSWEEKIDWNSRVVSTYHASVVGVFCLYILFFDKALRADPIRGDPWLVNVNIAITSGYLISDLLFLIFYWKAIGETVYIVHHCAMLYICFHILKEGILAYIGNFRLIAEISTPFVNQRWFLRTLRYQKSSEAYIINGVLMTVTFFLTRTAMIPAFYYYLYCMYGTDVYIGLGLLIQCSLIGSCVTIDVMNAIWMVKISRGWVKLIQEI